MINLLDIYEKDGLYDQFLYELLEQRKPWENISHKKMPSYDKHVDFVESKPYLHWYIIERAISAIPIGSVYISKKNEIGVFLKEDHQNEGYGKLTVNKLMEKHPEIPEFKANIAPLNSRSQAFFLNLGFKMESRWVDVDTDKIVQYTYTKTNPYHVAPILPSAHRQST